LKTPPAGPAFDFSDDERATIAELARTPKVVVSSTLDAPLQWANTQLVSENAIDAKPKKKGRYVDVMANKAS